MRASFSLAAGGLTVLVACGGVTVGPSSTDAGQDGSPTLREPKTHRAQGNACTTPRGPGTINGTPPPGAPCSKDADCTAGQNGRCETLPIEQSNPPGQRVCSYDQCTADADCGASSVCDCRNPANYDANTCFHGDCRVDADCGAGGWCSPSGTTVDSGCTTGIDPGQFGFFCHTAADECTDDADCPGVTPPERCMFSPTANHWVCQQQFCTG